MMNQGMVTNDEWLNKIERYYSKDKKCYHTLNHIREMYFLFDFYKDKFLEEFPELDIDKLKEVIAWHDSVYRPGSDNNEEESVQLYLSTGGRDQEIINGILSTKVGNTEFKTDIEKVLHDLDWSGFKDYFMMVKNESKIKYEAMEFGHYPEKIVVHNQVEFYKKFKDVELYRTKAFKGFNKSAKNNLERRIREIHE